MNFEKELTFLKEKELIIENQDLAIEFFQHVGWGRLYGYFESFFNSSGKFINNTKFKRIVDVYIFDRRLRNLILDAIERIEISLRSNLYLEISSRNFEGEWYFDDIFRDKSFWNYFYSKNIDKWSKTGVYKNFLKSNLSGTQFPLNVFLRIWSFGELITFFSELNSSMQKEIDKKILLIGVPRFENWLNAIRYLRNHCAHHERLWSRTLVLRINLRKEDVGTFKSNSSLGAYIKILDLFLQKISPKSSWKGRLKNLTEEFFINPKKLDLKDFFE